MSVSRSEFWRYARGLAGPVLLWILVAALLVEPVRTWLRGNEAYDDSVLREWIEEARVFRDTLPELVRDYLAAIETANPHAETDRYRLFLKGEKIREHLKSLGNPATKMYSGQLPLFPVLYRLEVHLDIPAGKTAGIAVPPLLWDSQLPRHPSQYRELIHPLGPQAKLILQYQLHAFNKRQTDEQAVSLRLRWVGILAVSGTALAGVWLALVQRRQWERQRQQALAKEQVDQAERRQEEAERRLLEQRLATQAAERQALELRSQVYASIGIMAGSYAHNIKNLLVRPNDLLRRCLEADALADGQRHMLVEVQQTLSTVTERLQQILHTVRRDPSQPASSQLELNGLLRELQAAWSEMAREKWKLELVFELTSEPLWLEGDQSHLQQAIENLLFNARDATFELRNQLRDQARAVDGADKNVRRQALIDAAAWRGEVKVRTLRQESWALLEVSDNGIGMTDDVRHRCLEPHFTTKRNNAVYEGNTTGMGLGLSFVDTVFRHHDARLEIESATGQGALFRARFALAREGVASEPEHNRITYPTAPPTTPPIPRPEDRPNGP